MAVEEIDIVYHPHYPNIIIFKDECWKSVPGYEELYEASTFGRIRSLGRWKQGVGRFGRYYMKDGIKKVDCKGANLVNKDGVGKLHKLHHVILHTFVGERPEGTECCHYDGNDSNNRLENLRWDTHKGNEGDKVRHGTSNRGERNGSSKLSKELVKEVRSLYQTGQYSYAKLSKRYSISLGTLSPLIKGITWNYPDCYPDGYDVSKYLNRTPAECFKGVNRWSGANCKKEVI